MMLFLMALTQDVFAGATVSSFKSESRKPQNYWSGGSAIDGDPKTAWMVPGEGGSVDALAEITGEADEGDANGGAARGSPEGCVGGRP